MLPSEVLKREWLVGARLAVGRHVQQDGSSVRPSTRQSVRPSAAAAASLLALWQAPACLGKRALPRERPREGGGRGEGREGGGESVRRPRTIRSLEGILRLDEIVVAHGCPSVLSGERRSRAREGLWSTRLCLDGLERSFERVGKGNRKLGLEKGRMKWEFVVSL